MAMRKLVGRLLLPSILKRHTFANLTYSQTRCINNYINGEHAQKKAFELDNDAQDPIAEELILDPFDQVQDVHQKFINDLNPPLKRSFNLASYVNSSKVLQELVKIGVSLYDIENLKPKAAKQLVQLDFERDCVKYLKFLTDSGLRLSNVGRFISEFPEIFQVPILELQTRLDYLKSKRFDTSQIVTAINRSSYILSNPVKTMDYKLGEFQVEFDMPASTIRNLVSKHPTVLAHPIHQYKLINFCLSEEFGFSLKQVHSILEQQPRTIDLLRPQLIQRLDLIHNEMGLSHSMIVKYPKLITGPEIEIKQRFLYLKKLKRDQFNPRLPLYVQPSALYNGTDEEFCEKHAKTHLNDYKLFVKTCL